MKINMNRISTMLLILTILTSLSVLPAAAASTGTLTRSFSTASVVTGETITVTLTPAPVTLFTFPGYQVIETVPAGFSVTANTALVATNVGNVWIFVQMGSAPITYTITAPSIKGTSSFNGTFQDQDKNTGIVGGPSTITVGQSAGTVTRSFSSSIVAPGASITATLTPAPANLFSSPGYQVNETVPEGFTVTTNTAAGVTNVGNVWTFIQMGSAPITYTITAPLTKGTGIFSGTFEDQLTNLGIVSGTTNLRVGSGYDANGNGRIDKNEAIQAVIDFFNGDITKQEAIDVVLAFFS